MGNEFEELNLASTRFCTALETVDENQLGDNKIEFMAKMGTIMDLVNKIGYAQKHNIPLQEFYKKACKETDLIVEFMDTLCSTELRTK